MTKRSRAMAIFVIAFTLFSINVSIGEGVAGQQPSDAVRVISLTVEPLQVSESEQPTVIVELANSSDSLQQFVVTATVDGEVFNELTVDVAANSVQTVRFRGPDPGDLAPGSHVIAVQDSQFPYIITSSGATTDSNVGNTGSGPQAGSTNPDGCVIRQPMQIRLFNVSEEITRVQDGSVELSFRNPPANDCEVAADLRIVMPTNLSVTSQEAASGVAGTANLYIPNIMAGSERKLALHFKCLRADEYLVNFAGTYWPVGNKDDFRPISLHQRFQCVEPSENVGTPKEGGTIDLGGDDEPSGTILSLPSDANWVWIVFILSMLFVLAGAIIIGVSRRKG